MENRISERTVVLVLTLGSILLVALVSTMPEFAISQGLSTGAVASFLKNPSFSNFLTALAQVGASISRFKALLLFQSPWKAVAFL